MRQALLELGGPAIATVTANLEEDSIVVFHATVCSRADEVHADGPEDQWRFQTATEVLCVGGVVAAAAFAASHILLNTLAHFEPPHSVSQLFVGPVDAMVPTIGAGVVPEQKNHPEPSRWPPEVAPRWV
eukprot:GHVS01089063.1.p2 GENE.GHVS01089063.1~~GHVS01089063.1.p2  ORF type:complete len:129 (-),score=16.24 GHVS01089063.1:2107-2493(-)